MKGKGAGLSGDRWRCLVPALQCSPPLVPTLFCFFVLVRMRKRGRIACRTLALVFCCWLQVSSVAGQYRFVSWTIDDGLPQHSVNAIVQTRDGYLWMATIDGLVRYDGVRFTVFERSNTPALRSNRFVCLYEDSDGALWAGTDSNGVVRYRDSVFQTLTTADGLPNDTVKELAPAAGGGVLINTAGGFVIWRDGRFSPGGEPWWIPQAETVRAPNGTIWRWVDAPTRRLLKAHYGAAYQPFTSSPGSLELYLFIARGLVLLDDQAGSLWGSLNGEVFSIRDGVLTRYRVQDAPVSEQITAVRYPPSIPAGERLEPDLLNACVARDGTLWLGTQRGLLNFRTGRVLRYTTAHGLTDDFIEATLIDREGSLWVGTPKGLTRVTRQFITGITRADGLPRLEVYPLLEDHSGAVWIGTNQLTRWANGRVTNYEWKRGRVTGHLFALHEDRQQRLWVSVPDGLLWFKNGRYTEFPRAALRSLGIAGYQLDCYDLHEDRAGQMWLASGKGLLRWDGRALTAWRQREGLPGDGVRVLHEDRAGRLWLGTANGLACWESGKVTSFAAETQYGKIIALHEDRDGVLWIGSYDSGLFRLKDGRFTHFTQADGLFNNEIFHLLEDDVGYFWISSNKGLSRVSKQQLDDFAVGRLKALTVSVYSKQDGMPSTECNTGRQPAGLKTRDGRLWFPTQMGVAVFDPRDVPHNAQAPPVLIESAVSQHQNLPLHQALRLLPGQENLEINYTGLSFIKPEQVKFKYRLTGWDTDWVQAGTRRTAYYSNLSPGEYEFTVIAANSDAVWNLAGAHLHVTVVPPFYRTWWWFGLMALSALGVVALAYRYRMAQVQRRLAVQEAFARQLIETQERDRQRIAAELHDSLGQNLQVIKNRALLGVTQGGLMAAQRQFQELNELAAAAIEEVRAIAHDLRPPNLTRLGLASTLEEMLEEVAGATGLAISVTIPALDGWFTPAEELNLFRIVQEAVNNIVKHAEATQASVTMERDDDTLRVVIRDNGRGFVVSDAALASRKNGVGLTSLAERVLMLGGSQQVISTLGQGTTITLKFPLPRTNTV